MRRLVAGSLISGLFVLGSFTIVGGQGDPVVPPTQVRTTPGTLTNMIGEVDVPWEILEYVQMKYEGHAVTKADKVRRGTSELYRLRVDRDDIATDHDSIAVLFNMQWKLVGEEKYSSPPPAPTVQKKQEQKREMKVEDKPVQSQDEENRNDSDDTVEGGRGAGEEQEVQRPTVQEPAREEPVQDSSNDE